MSNFVEIKNFKINKSQILYYSFFEREICQVNFRYSNNINQFISFSDIWLDINILCPVIEYSNPSSIFYFNNRFNNEFNLIGKPKKEFCLNIGFVQNNGLNFSFETKKELEQILQDIER